MKKILAMFLVLIILICTFIIGAVIFKISSQSRNTSIKNIVKSQTETTYTVPTTLSESTESTVNSVPSKDQDKGIEDIDKDFRKAQWGMTKEQIKRLENSSPLYEADDILLYDIELNGLPGIKVNCGYLFRDGEFFRGSYTFNSEHTNQNDYINDFKNIKSLFVKKYGKPQKDNVNWKNTLYKGNPEEYGFAVSMGHLNYFTFWETKDKIVSLALKGDNFKISLEAVYWNKESLDSKIDLNGF